jgi:hypothetical protein
LGMRGWPLVPPFLQSLYTYVCSGRGLARPGSKPRTRVDKNEDPDKDEKEDKDKDKNAETWTGNRTSRQTRNQEQNVDKT